MYKVLIVDDNVVDRESIRELVPWESFHICEIILASNGYDGYEKAVAHSPDLIITDVSMPNMSGLEMIVKVHHVLPDIKVIFMSCFDDFDYAKFAISLKAHAYILKPIELSELTDAISRTLDVIKKDEESKNYITSLEKQLSSSIDTVREQMLRDILYNGVNLNITPAMAQRLNIQVKTFYSVLCISIHHENQKEYPAEYKYLHVNNIREICQSISPKNRIYTIIQKFDVLIAIVYLDTCSEYGNVYYDVLNITETLISEVRSHLNVDITVCVGSVSEELSQLYMLFNEAEQVLISQNISAFNNILMAQSDFGDDKSFHGIKEEIVAIIDSESIDAIDDFIDKYLDNAENKVYIKSFVFSVVNEISLILVERNENFKNIFGDHFLIFKKLSEFDTILNVQQWIKNILIVVVKYFTSNLRYDGIIGDTKRIIDEEYATIDNVNKIAEKLFISASHLRYLFKKVTGETIFDYILKKKMEHAKQMLENKYYKVYEVAEALGYKSLAYFTYTFKGYAGMTPNEYRKKYSQ